MLINICSAYILGYFWYLNAAGDENSLSLSFVLPIFEKHTGIASEQEGTEIIPGAPAAKPENPVPETPEKQTSGYPAQFQSN